MSRAVGKPGPPCRRILIIKPSSLGDVVHGLPVLAALRAAYPRARIAWLVATPLVSLLAKHPLLDEVISFDRQGFGRMVRSPAVLAKFVMWLLALRRRRFDLVIDLQGLFRSGFLAWVTGAGRRVGFADAREMAPLFYTQRVRCERSVRHAVDKNLAIAAALGLVARGADGQFLPSDGPELFPLGLQPEELRSARTLLATCAGRPIGRFTAIIPGARWPSKRWGAAQLAGLIDQLAQRANAGHAIVLLGGAGERAFADQVKAATTTRIVDLVGQTKVRQVVALLALSDLVICHDSGPMHVAAALRKPLVAVFGPTDPARTGPYSHAARVVQLPLACVPCRRRVCPLKHHACMTTLTVDRVLQEVLKLPIDGPADPEPFTPSCEPAAR